MRIDKNQSEHWFEAIFNLPGMAILIVDDSGSIVKANKTSTKLFGYNDLEMTSMPVDSLIPQKVRGHHMALRESYAKSPTPRPMGLNRELNAQRKDNSIFPVEISLNSTTIDGKRYVVVYLLDISLRVKETNEKIELLNRNNALLETAADGIVTYDSTGIIHLSNPSAREILGIENESVTCSIFSLIPELEQHINSVSQQKQSEKNERVEFQIKNKNEKELPIRLKSRAFNSSDGLMYVATIHNLKDEKEAEFKLRMYSQRLEDLVADRTKKLEQLAANLKVKIEEIRAAETSLQRSQQLYIQIARNFPKGTINVFDKNLNYIFVEGEELFKVGIESSALLGRPYQDVLSEKISEKVIPFLKLVLEGESKSMEIEKEGKFYVINAVPLRKEDGEIDRILVVEKNITEEKKAELETRAALAKERELNELKSRFVTLASHEFRTPLATILSSTRLTETYLEKGRTENIEKHLKRVGKNVQHLNSILEDFLSLERLEEGKADQKIELINLKELFEEMIEQLEPQMKEGQFIENKTGSLPKQFGTNALYLKNILYNLLSNAIKYSGPATTIRLVCKQEKNGVRIGIKDQGYGIPQADQIHLFNRFFRASNAGNMPGTGIGLYLVKRYAERLGGEVFFSSDEGKGSTFEVTIKDFLEGE